MQWYSDRNLLLSDLDELLTKTVRVRNYEIILLDETTRVFVVFRSFPSARRSSCPTSTQTRRCSATFRKAARNILRSIC